MSYSAQTRSVNVPTLRVGALRLQVEVAHAFVGVDNEHFLHHRRRGCGDHSCGVLGSSSLDKFDSRMAARPHESAALGKTVSPLLFGRIFVKPSLIAQRLGELSKQPHLHHNWNETGVGRLIAACG